MGSVFISHQVFPSIDMETALGGMSEHTTPIRNALTSGKFKSNGSTDITESTPLTANMTAMPTAMTGEMMVFK
ncbi:MAG: hypothetical protein IJB99_10585, partial [Clostridia bacterium]|nr:hypothetical protein [Clostridia bacterium]